MKGDSPQFALDRIDPERITFARELRGITKKELALRIGKTSSAISQIERGIIRPDLETFVQISMALQVPTTFFMFRESKEEAIRLDSCHFRAKRATSLTLRKQCTRKGEVLLGFLELLEQRGVIFPSDGISSYPTSTSDTLGGIEKAASDLRRYWGMGVGPIPNMIKLVESKGVFVIPIHSSCDAVDAYSTWRTGRPCIMISLSKPASRIRFDIGHELAHLLLHEDAQTGDIRTEREAHRFAAAFLAPREGFLPECPRRWSFQAFRKLKFRWKMSISALLYRAKDLGCLSQSAYQRAMVHMSDMRTDEGEEWEKERPTLFEQALELLQNRVTLSELASDLNIYSSELRDLLDECVPEDLLDKIDKKNEEDTNKIVRLRE